MSVKLVLITCCKTKAPGGKLDYQSSIRLQANLSKPSHEQLMAARKELANLLGFPAGCDLGHSENAPGLTFMPAYQRYIGRVYRAAEVENLYPGSSVRLTIISALYGVIDADDLIRKYELMMDHKVGNITVAQFWKEHGLGRIVCEYITNIHPQEIHDLLIDLYRKAITPWPKCEHEDISITKHCFPGQGSGAMYRRGEELKRLLRDC